ELVVSSKPSRLSYHLMFTVQSWSAPDWKRPSMPAAAADASSSMSKRDLGGNPLSQMARRHRPLDHTGQFGVNHGTLTQQGLRQPARESPIHEGSFSPSECAALTCRAACACRPALAGLVMRCSIVIR